MKKNVIINLEKVTKKVAGQRKILNNINLKIEEGEKIGLLGANGSGKTTLIEIIAGITKATSGKIKVNCDVNKKQKFGLQFQEGYWPKGVNGKLILNYYFSKTKDNIEYYQNLLNTFGVNDYLHKDLNSLSGGERQRFNALLAIINSPEIIILDELLTGLDLKFQIQLIDFFKSYFKKYISKTLILISHNPEEITELCDRIILLENGQIVLDTSLTAILKNYSSLREYLIEYYHKLGNEKNEKQEN